MIKIKAILLCAGYATRLYPLTQNQPKALLSIGDKTLLGHIMDKIEQIQEIDEVFVVTNDMFLSNFWSWRESYKPKKRTHLISDGTKSNEERIGALGDLKYVIDLKKIDSDIIVIAGDNLFEFSLRSFLDYYKSKNASVVGLYDIGDKKKAAKKYGVVEVDSNNKIIDFQEKPAAPKTSLVSTACYIFKASDTKQFGEYMLGNGKWDHLGDFIKWLADTTPTYGFVFKDKWFDIGSFEALEEAYEAHKKE